jgi:hypothetical protein
MKEQAIKNLMVQHNLPKNIAESLVSVDGTVDQAKLDLVKAGISWGKNPASNAQPEVVQSLLEQFEAAKNSRNASLMLALRSQLSELGVHNP